LNSRRFHPAGLAPLLIPAISLAALDRPYTLRNQEPHLLELQRESLLDDSAAMGFASPISDAEPAPTRSLRIAYGDSANHQSIGLRLVGGEEYRYAGGHAWSSEAGGLLSGRKAFASFHLDARIFSERNASNSSFDREEMDTQNQATTGSIDYSSYARYRGDFTLDTQLGRLTAARDAAHWGPGVFNNLTFNQDAIPFDQIAYHASIGPLTVTSLYGDLTAGASQSFSPANLDGKNLYAHRYELSLGRRWTAGITEQLFLYGQNRPYLFAPIFPLFIAKGFMYEEANNGNLAADLAYRLPKRGYLYAEFLLDDLESPSSLFLKEYSQNKWAWMAGAHFLFDLPPGKLGLIGEYARLEPWVYSHFTPNTAQASNVGYPLGNPYGPNSQNITFKAYLRPRGNAYFGLTQVLLWKGTDPGSDLNDPSPRESTTRKAFLGGAGSPSYTLQPEFAWDWSGLTLDCSAALGEKTKFRTGLRYFY
jgi:hypothetical protein